MRLTSVHVVLSLVLIGMAAPALACRYATLGVGSVTIANALTKEHDKKPMSEKEAKLVADFYVDEKLHRDMRKKINALCAIDSKKASSCVPLCSEVPEDELGKASIIEDDQRFYLPADERAALLEKQQKLEAKWSLK